MKSANSLLLIYLLWVLPKDNPVPIYGTVLGKNQLGVFDFV